MTFDELYHGVSCFSTDGRCRSNLIRAVVANNKTNDIKHPTE